MSKELIQGNLPVLLQKAISALPNERDIETFEDCTRRSVRLIRGYNRTGCVQARGVYTFVQETTETIKGKKNKFFLSHEGYTGPVKGVIFSHGDIVEICGDEITSKRGKKTYARTLLQGFLASDRFATVKKDDTQKQQRVEYTIFETESGEHKS